MEWCTHHRGDPPATADDDADSRKKTTDIDEWDQKFMQVDQEMLFEIILVRDPRSLNPATEANTTSTGCQLHGYQGSFGCRLQDCRQHDQGQVT